MMFWAVLRRVWIVLVNSVMSCLASGSFADPLLALSMLRTLCWVLVTRVMYSLSKASPSREPRSAASAFIRSFMLLRCSVGGDAAARSIPFVLATDWILASRGGLAVVMVRA